MAKRTRPSHTKVERKEEEERENLATEYATSESCPNRLLAFAKVRSVAIGGAAAAQSAARQIVNRFCNVALENQRMGLWSLDLLQMCTLHGGDAFALALNSQDRLNDLLAFFLNPTKVKSVSVQLQLKLLSLIQTWAITYKNTFSSNNFKHAYDRLKRSGVVYNVDDLRNLHWLPDKDVFGNSTESATYNLQEVVSEMSTENRQLHSELQTIFKVASEQQATSVSEDSKLKKKLAEASKRTLEIKQAVHASQAFWNDIVEHLEVEPEDFKEITSNVQCIFESMEQSITYCITALKMDSSSRTEDSKSKNGGLDGDHKEGEPVNINRTGSELEKNTSVKNSGFWSCALCNLRFDDKNRLLNHIESPDHQHQFENRLHNKAKSPVSSPQEPVKEKGNQAQSWRSIPGRKEKTIFNPYVEVQPKPPIVYSEPYVPLNLDKSSTTPPAPATGTAENVMDAAPGLRPATLTKPKASHLINCQLLCYLTINADGSCFLGGSGVFSVSVDLENCLTLFSLLVWDKQHRLRCIVALQDIPEVRRAKEPTGPTPEAPQWLCPLAKQNEELSRPSTSIREVAPEDVSGICHLLRELDYGPTYHTSRFGKCPKLTDLTIADTFKRPPGPTSQLKGNRKTSCLRAQSRGLASACLECFSSTAAGMKGLIVPQSEIPKQMQASNAKVLKRQIIDA
ncbi:Vacuolar protein sorting-associated protein 27 [Taenia solium]|eukprot:TsM_000901200 transcript=TsM_000901200 gene=TsM_000901200